MLPDDLRKRLHETLPPILDVQDICSTLSVSAKTVMREITRENGLPAYRTEEGWNIARADFIAYLSRHST